MFCICFCFSVLKAGRLDIWVKPTFMSSHSRHRLCENYFLDVSSCFIPTFYNSIFQNTLNNCCTVCELGGIVYNTNCMVLLSACNVWPQVNCKLHLLCSCSAWAALLCNCTVVIMLCSESVSRISSLFHYHLNDGVMWVRLIKCRLLRSSEPLKHLLGII